MSSNGQAKKIALLSGFILFPVALVFLFTSADHFFKVLPIYGPKVPFDTVVNGETVSDTMYHTIPYWAFTDQDGQTFTQKDVEGKILVVDFFFTSCPTICPKMSQQLRRVQMQTDDVPGVMILSYSIDPENDTPEKLKQYAEKMQAGERWKFLTGDKEDIYEIAATGYFLHAEEDENAEGGFMHSPMFMVIDKQKRIRGLYDGTDTDDVNRLVEEIKMLLKEERLDAKAAAEKIE